MAMMMTGRVLLVCALCVLWCGAGGGCDDTPQASPSDSGGTVVGTGAGQSGEADNAVCGVGPSGSSSGSGVKSMVSASFSACTLSPPNPVDGDVLQGGKGTTATLSMDSSEKSVKPQSAEPPAPAQPNLDRQEASTSNAENHSPIKPHTAGNEVVSGGATGKENTQRAAVTGGPSSDTRSTTLQAAPQEQPKTELIIVPAGKELQISTEEMHQTSPSEAQKLLLGQETPSKDDAEDQNTEGTAASDSVKDEAASSLVETTAPPISTSGGADTKSVASEDADNAQQPNHKEAHKDPEPQNTSPAFTTTEALPQTAIPLTTAPTNDNTTPGDSDSSTAVSHTTSPPLLLLVVACAAAAVVAA
ncbi:Mucin-associated surface protein (MASP) [Trypanosoma cruzi]|uniref:Mucin-associated surface protein (MASP), putative n=2 Tax=Trypanosoma cruzi TaxID=5693 RepID=Q4CTA8_TRYCC|nr:mucin-associated surface protein (MASP), putative [Trypanosoma cruzi]EAN83510.1 mucin-associated surface protein (MASP), putative [Trypanosoma cruzi]PWU90938.1 Mucin-associated surface protein (MASP) [Trypanosoma cruzi]|eukprot:XP_805361.1 mucin-associated surface protein (MASP) [Trypanosoma cruzi strain CL Brener]